MWEEIASGSGLNIATLATHENKVNEGERAKLALTLSNPVSPTTVSSVLRYLQAKEVTDAQVSGSGKEMNITYRKGFAWVAVIIAGLVLLAIMVVGWRFYHEAAGSPIGWVLILTVAAATIVILTLTLRRDSG